MPANNTKAILIIVSAIRASRIVPQGTDPIPLAKAIAAALDNAGFEVMPKSENENAS